MTKQRDGLKRALSPSKPTGKEWESDETAVANLLKQEEEQHYREVLAKLEAEKARLDQEVQEFLTRHPEALKASKPSPPKKHLSPRFALTETRTGAKKKSSKSPKLSSFADCPTTRPIRPRSPGQPGSQMAAWLT
jgi:ATP-dependent Clp protease ATP-binding subunit ClpA